MLSEAKMVDHLGNWNNIDLDHHEAHDNQSFYLKLKAYS
jgi:hypothetical protein